MIVSGVNIFFTSLSCRCLTQGAQVFLQVKGMDLAHLTREAQGTEVALGVSTLVMLKTLGTTCM